MSKTDLYLSPSVASVAMLQCSHFLNPFRRDRYIFHVIKVSSLTFSFQYLHRVLVAEVNALQGMAAIGQRPLLMEVSIGVVNYCLLFLLVAFIFCQAVSFTVEACGFES